ncbi:K+/H+ antiporter [Marinococcus halophilus]|uniref:K+/H+ antiporter n=1 Tax=Marinococcus halophilus TaxID=1371 RepID=A0A510Y2V9_MARHA|nr:K+/H+ antiporter [Marinococcus halophilus]
MDFLEANNGVVLLVGLLLVAGIIVAKFSNRLGLPALVLFILIGMLIGSDGLEIIYFDNAEVAQLVGIFALVIILFEGGLQTKWATVRRVAAPSISLATAGVLITSVCIGGVAYLLLDFTWYEALLLGSIVGSTDAAAVFAALKERNIKAKLGATLEAESGTNDPMAVFLTISFIELLTNADANIWMLIPSFFWQIGAGIIFGLLVGRFASFAINHIGLESSGLYPIFSVAFALLAYSVTAAIGASGFLAVYVAALVIGNSELTFRYSIFQFNEGFAWMSQILMFIILGLLAFPGQVFTADIMLAGIALSFILMFIARPLAVFISTAFLGYTLKERTFLSWAGLRGAVPIVLATFPVVAGLDNAQLIFNLVFFIVLTSALIQGSSISYVAKLLHLVGPKKEIPYHSIELVSMGSANAEMVQFEASEESAIVGKQLYEINFPNDATVSAMVRNDELVTPGGNTEIQEGDFLYILVSRQQKDDLRRLLNRKKHPEPKTTP